MQNSSFEGRFFFRVTHTPAHVPMCTTYTYPLTLILSVSDEKFYSIDEKFYSISQKNIPLIIVPGSTNY